MAQPREFSVVREISRREVRRQPQRFVGVTVSSPEFRTLDDKGLLEWVCDIRIGYKSDWAVIKNCEIAQWALGVVTDINIPVLCERSESGRVTVIARSQINLPDIRLDAYEYEELGFAFMRNLCVEPDGSLIDGYGYEMAPAGTVDTTEIPAEDLDDTPEPENDAMAFGTGDKNKTFTFVSESIDWGSTDFVYGDTPLGARRFYWLEA